MTENAHHILTGRRESACGVVYRLDTGDAGVGHAAWCPTRAARAQAGSARVARAEATVDEALARARRLPEWVYFAPREDAFAADVAIERRDEVLRMMQRTLARGVGIALTTRGTLRDAPGLVALARAWPGRLSVRVGVFSRDAAVEAKWEAGLGPASGRIALAAALQEAGATVALEIGPIIPFVNDDARALRDLLRAAARAGIRQIVPRWAEDSPGLVRQVEREISRSSGRMLAGWFNQSGATRADGTRTVPFQARRQRRQIIHDVARELGLTVVECRCVHEGAAAACITGPAVAREQLSLFGQERSA
ncbi:MAG: hypothetical protein KC635_08015 [Myxococcales bacterium]|nr:hypothetical protein [Myxococcales bacterium]MCB9732903.1 hypothetical protein [Deltaproteobacteria bacterium]